MVERSGVTPTRPFLPGQAYSEHRRASDAKPLVKFSQLLGNETVGQLLAQTNNVVFESKRIKQQGLPRVIPDYTEPHCRPVKRRRFRLWTIP